MCVGARLGWPEVFTAVDTRHAKPIASGPPAARHCLPMARTSPAASLVVGTRDRGEPIVAFTDVAGWNAWLAGAHAAHGPVWLRLAKKGNSESSLRYLEAVERGLCWGWIDSQKGALDERWFVQRFSRRTSKSPWSQINRATAERLMASGEMRAAGLAEVERAKQDGRWDRAYAPASGKVVPVELAAALQATSGASARFEALDATNRYALCYRVQAPKQVTTRARKAKDLVAALMRGEVPHPRPAARATKARHPPGR